jgi:hypothetical protein
MKLVRDIRHRGAGTIFSYLPCKATAVIPLEISKDHRDRIISVLVYEKPKLYLALIS